MMNEKKREEKCRNKRRKENQMGKKLSPYPFLPSFSLIVSAFDLFDVSRGSSILLLISLSPSLLIRELAAKRGLCLWLKDEDEQTRETREELLVDLPPFLIIRIYRQQNLPLLEFVMFDWKKESKEKKDQEFPSSHAVNRNNMKGDEEMGDPAVTKRRTKDSMVSTHVSTMMLHDVKEGMMMMTMLLPPLSLFYPDDTTWGKEVI